MATLIQLRRGTAAQWKSQNPILALGEAGYETDSQILKIGDGVTEYNSLRPTYANGDIQIILLDKDEWSGDTAPYTQTVQVDLMTADFNPNVALIASDSYDVALVQLQEYSKLFKGVSSDGAITFYATTPPKVDLSLRIKRL